MKVTLLIVSILLSTTLSFAQDCGQLKEKSELMEIKLQVLNDDYKKLSEYSDRQEAMQTIRSTKLSIRENDLAYRACLKNKGEMGDVDLLSRGLRQRSTGALILIAGGAIVTLASMGVGGGVAVVAIAVGVGLFGTAEILSGSLLVLKATKGAK
jgi:hypothetical protein